MSSVFTLPTSFLNIYFKIILLLLPCLPIRFTLLVLDQNFIGISVVCGVRYVSLPAHRIWSVVTEFIFNVSNTFMLARLERHLVKLLVYINSRRFRSILHTFSLTACIVLTDRRVVKAPVDLANRNSASGQNPKSVESSSHLFSLAR